MTAKRFNRVGGYVYDGDKCISHFEDVTHRDDIVTLLNELHEENQRLQEENKELEKFKHFIFKSLNHIYEDKE